MYAEIAVQAPLKTTLWYSVPSAWQVQVGTWVWVPLQHRHVMGLVVHTRLVAPKGVSCVPIGMAFPGMPLPADLMALLHFVTAYYGVSYGSVLRLLGKTSQSYRITLCKKEFSAQEQDFSSEEKKWIAWLSAKRTRSVSWEVFAKKSDSLESLDAILSLCEKGCVNFDRVRFPHKDLETKKESLDPLLPVPLSPAQQQVFLSLVSALDRPEGGAFLLHGVTGAGKTHVYLSLISEALRRRKTALVLVPEIMLTPQLVERFQAQLGSCVGILHSALPLREKNALYEKLEKGSLQVLVGARSALFAPLPHMGVLIVDEEHDTAFKQQDGVWYHARDMALVRGRAAGAVVVLGSATPSLEAWRLVEQRKAQLLSLQTRYSAQELPAVSFVDLRKHVGVAKEGWLSYPLLTSLAETVRRGEQALLFLNRRGYASSLACTTCGKSWDCPACSVSLTWHKGRHALVCHYCGWVQPLPEVCSACGGEWVSLGVGTEQVTERLQRHFPEIRVARLDRDAVTSIEAEHVLQSIREGQVDVVVGTQMVAKGHDFPRLTLVGVLLADQGLHWPDFRASERTFQLLTQVAGRAGRAALPGKVLIQTFAPDHPALLRVEEHDVCGFTKEELLIRKERFYPPYSRMVAVRLDGVESQEVQICAQEVASQVKRWCARASVRMDVLGPAPAPLSRLKGRVRYQFFIRSETVAALHQTLESLRQCSVPKQVRLHLDIDPVSML